MSSAYLIELTNLCTNRCPACPTHLGVRKTGEMDPKTFESAIDQFIDNVSDIRTRRIALHGFGDPLCSKYVWMNLDCLEQRLFRNVDFSTNCMLLDTNKAHLLSKYKCLSFVRLSLNSSRPDVMEYINKGSDFDRVMSNIRNYLQMPKQYKVIIQLMQTNLNADETADEMKRAVGPGGYEIWTKKLNGFKGQVTDSGRLETHDSVDCTKYAECFINIHWNGDITGCCYDNTETQVAGNVRDGIFSAAVQDRIRLWQTIPPPFCRQCLGII